MALIASINFDNVVKVELCRQRDSDGGYMCMWIHYADDKVDIIHLAPPSPGERIERVISDALI